MGASRSEKGIATLYSHLEMMTQNDDTTALITGMDFAGRNLYHVESNTKTIESSIDDISFVRIIYFGETTIKITLEVYNEKAEDHVHRSACR